MAAKPSTKVGKKKAKRGTKTGQRKALRKELVFLKEVYVRKAHARRSLHELQNQLVKDAAKSTEEPEEYKPLSKAVHQAMKERQNSRSGKARKVFAGQYEFSYRGGFYRDRQRFWEKDWVNLRILLNHCSNESTQLTLDTSQFVNLVNEGAASAQEGNFLGQASNKTAYSEVGYAVLAGANARAWNRSVFGFVSTFTLPGPGKENAVNVSSHMHASFVWPDGWLEALSFGRLAWGEVTVNAHLDVLVGPDAFRDGVDTLLHGVSPRGNHREGEIGIFHPLDETRDVDHAVEFTVTNPQNGQHQVAVFELAEVFTERHHRVDRCNAVAWGTYTWDPVDVSIVTEC